MAPDLNSLPPSYHSPPTRNMHSSPSAIPSRQDSASPRTTSLAAAAAINASDRSRRSSASLQNRGSPRLDRGPSDRRRSLVTNALNLNDPTIPSPGEMVALEHRSGLGGTYSATSPVILGGRTTIATGDPHHQRQPSLGEIHNELEQEQEAQVNRMLQMIRLQQEQLEALQRTQGDHHNDSGSNNNNADRRPSHINIHNSNAIADEPTPGSERSFSFQQRPHSISRNPSSANRSPALRPQRSQEGHYLHHSASEWMPPSPLDSLHRRSSIRDESTYYQAETANLTRENQMLKLRIRELEKQLAESAVSERPATNISSPSPSSHLATSSAAETQQ